MPFLRALRGRTICTRHKSHNKRFSPPERLEARVLLASAASDVFAKFDGVLASATSTATIPITFTTANATLSGGKTTIGFQVVAANGSPLDPASLRILDAHNHALATRLMVPDLG